MIIINAVEGKKICLGRIGENEARAVRFDVSRIQAEFPGAEYSLLNMRPSDPDSYPVNSQYIRIENGGLFWTIQSGDLAEDGLGECELKATLGSQILKDTIWTTEVLRALDGDGTPPDPWQSWQQQVENDADRAEAAAELLEHPGAEAETLPAGSQATAGYADGVFTFGIPKGKDGLDGDTPTASVSKVGHTATITITDKDGTTTAQIGDGTDGEDGFSPSASVTKSGKTATISITDKEGTTTAKITDGEDGEPGVTPNVTAGTTTTLPAGSDATVTRRAGSPDSAPVFDFGIPQGPKGDPGEVTEEELEAVETELKSQIAYDEGNINDLFERVGFVGDITTTNLLNESALTQSKMVDYSGNVVDAPNNTWYVTDLLSIGNVTELFTTYRLANMALFACYDSNDTFIGIITTNSTGKERLVQNNDYWKVILYPGTAKIRMNLRSTWLGSSATTRQMLTKYYYPSSYVAYGSSATVSPSTIAAKADFMYKYGIRALGLFENTNVYSNLDTMPANTYACFYSTGATGISNRPENIFATILEVLTISTSDVLANGTVQIAMLRDVENNYWVYIRSYLTSTWRAWRSLNQKEKTITVRTSGGNYSSVVDAIKYTMDNPPTKETPVVIDVGAGTFDLNDVTTLVESESIDQRGLFLMPYVTLQGKGRDKTILSFEYNGSNDDVMSQVSALNIVYESALKDMKIQVKNIRYAVHADYALSTQAQDDTNTLLRDNTFIMENVELVHKGFDSGLSPTYKVPSAWGQGLRTNLIRKFINCRFESFEAGPWFCHDRIETSKGCQLFFDGCEFIPHDNSASLRFVSWGSNLLHIVNIRNCLVRTFVSLGVVTTYNASAKIDYFVKADDLDALFVEDTENDSAKKMNYFNYRTLMCINKTNNTVTKFTPVKVLTYNNAVVNTRNGIQGIAMHNAAANEMVNVQIDGAVAIATSFTAGTRIGYNNGAWVEDQNGFLVVMNALYCRFV